MEKIEIIGGQVRFVYPPPASQWHRIESLKADLKELTDLAQLSSASSRWLDTLDAGDRVWNGQIRLYCSEILKLLGVQDGFETVTTESRRTFFLYGDPSPEDPNAMLSGLERLLGYTVRTEPEKPLDPSAIDTVITSGRRDIDTLVDLALSPLKENALALYDRFSIEDIGLILTQAGSVLSRDDVLAERRRVKDRERLAKEQSDLDAQATAMGVDYASMNLAVPPPPILSPVELETLKGEANDGNDNSDDPWHHLDEFRNVE